MEKVTLYLDEENEKLIEWKNKLVAKNKLNKTVNEILNKYVNGELVDISGVDKQIIQLQTKLEIYENIVNNIFSNSQGTIDMKSTIMSKSLNNDTKIVVQQNPSIEEIKKDKFEEKSEIKEVEKDNVDEKLNEKINKDDTLINSSNKNDKVIDKVVIDKDEDGDEDNTFVLGDIPDLSKLTGNRIKNKDLSDSSKLQDKYGDKRFYSEDE